MGSQDGTSPKVSQHGLDHAGSWVLHNITYSMPFQTTKRLFLGVTYAAIPLSFPCHLSMMFASAEKLEKPGVIDSCNEIARISWSLHDPLKMGHDPFILANGPLEMGVSRLVGLDWRFGDVNPWLVVSSEWETTHHPEPPIQSRQPGGRREEVASFAGIHFQPQEVANVDVPFPPQAPPTTFSAVSRLVSPVSLGLLYGALILWANTGVSCLKTTCMCCCLLCLFFLFFFFFGGGEVSFFFFFLRGGEVICYHYFFRGGPPKTTDP